MMLKIVLKDYKAQLKWDCLLDINFLIVAFIIFYFDGKLLFLGIPYLIGDILYKNCNIRNNKAFYLCPLSLNDRKKYVRTSIFINLLIPAILFFIVGGVLLIIDSIDIYVFIAVFISMVVFLICRNLDITGYQCNNSKFHLYNMSIIASNWIGIINLLFVISNNIYLENFYIYFLALLFLQICVFVFVIRYYRKMIDILVVYSI